MLSALPYLAQNNGEEGETMYFDESMIVRRVPKWIIERTRDSMEYHSMGLYDAFNEAVREYKKPSKELSAAFMSSDYRSYIPSAYTSESMNGETT